MSTKLVWALGVITVGCTVITGCGSGEEAPAPSETPGSTSDTQTGHVADAEAALAEWQACVASAESRMADPVCKEAAATLARIGGPPLEQALSQLDDETTSPHGKVLIVDGFSGRLNSYASNLLKQMTAKEKNETTRACATALLSSIQDLNLIQFLIPLTSDPNPQVRFSALLGVAMAAQEDSDFRKQLADLYYAPDTNANMKEHIIGVFSKTPTATDIPILVEAIKDTSFNPQLRRDAAIALGRVGDQAAMEALLASTTSEAPVEYRDAADLAVAAIKERLQAESDGDTLELEVKLLEPEAP